MSSRKSDRLKSAQVPSPPSKPASKPNYKAPKKTQPKSPQDGSSATPKRAQTAKSVGSASSPSLPMPADIPNSQPLSSPKIRGRDAFLSASSSSPKPSYIHASLSQEATPTHTIPILQHALRSAIPQPLVLTSESTSVSTSAAHAMTELEATSETTDYADSGSRRSQTRPRGGTARQLAVTKSKDAIPPVEISSGAPETTSLTTRTRNTPRSSYARSTDSTETGAVTTPIGSPRAAAGRKKRDSTTSTTEASAKALEETTEVINLDSDDDREEATLTMAPAPVPATPGPSTGSPLVKRTALPQNLGILPQSTHLEATPVVPAEFMFLRGKRATKPTPMSLRVPTGPAPVEAPAIPSSSTITTKPPSSTPSASPSSKATSKKGAWMKVSHDSIHAANEPPPAHSSQMDVDFHSIFSTQSTIERHSDTTPGNGAATGSIAELSKDTWAPTTTSEEEETGNALLVISNAKRNRSTRTTSPPKSSKSKPKSKANVKLSPAAAKRAIAQMTAVAASKSPGQEVHETAADDSTTKEVAHESPAQRASHHVVESSAIQTDPSEMGSALTSEPSWEKKHILDVAAVSANPHLADPDTTSNNLPQPASSTEYPSTSATLAHVAQIPVKTETPDCSKAESSSDAPATSSVPIEEAATQELPPIEEADTGNHSSAMDVDTMPVITVTSSSSTRALARRTPSRTPPPKADVASSMIPLPNQQLPPFPQLQHQEEPSGQLSVESISPDPMEDNTTVLPAISPSPLVESPLALSASYSTTHDSSQRSSDVAIATLDPSSASAPPSAELPYEPITTASNDKAVSSSESTTAELATEPVAPDPSSSTPTNGRPRPKAKHRLVSAKASASKSASATSQTPTQSKAKGSPFSASSPAPPTFSSAPAPESFRSPLKPILLSEQITGETLTTHQTLTARANLNQSFWRVLENPFTRTIDSDNEEVGINGTCSPKEAAEEDFAKQCSTSQTTATAEPPLLSRKGRSETSSSLDALKLAAAGSSINRKQARQTLHFYSYNYEGRLQPETPERAQLLMEIMSESQRRRFPSIIKKTDSSAESYFDTWAGDQEFYATPVVEADRANNSKTNAEYLSSLEAQTLEKKTEMAIRSKSSSSKASQSSDTGTKKSNQKKVTFGSISMGYASHLTPEEVERRTWIEDQSLSTTPTISGTPSNTSKNSTQDISEEGSAITLHSFMPSLERPTSVLSLIPTTHSAFDIGDIDDELAKDLTRVAILWKKARGPTPYTSVADLQNDLQIPLLTAASSNEASNFENLAAKADENESGSATRTPAQQKAYLKERYRNSTGPFWTADSIQSSLEIRKRKLDDLAQAGTLVRTKIKKAKPSKESEKDDYEDDGGPKKPKRGSPANKAKIAKNDTEANKKQPSEKPVKTSAAAKVKSSAAAKRSQAALTPLPRDSSPINDQTGGRTSTNSKKRKRPDEDDNYEIPGATAPTPNDENNFELSESESGASIPTGTPRVEKKASSAKRPSPSTSKTSRSATMSPTSLSTFSDDSESSPMKVDEQHERPKPDSSSIQMIDASAYKESKPSQKSPKNPLVKKAAKPTKSVTVTNSHPAEVDENDFVDIEGGTSSSQPSLSSTQPHYSGGKEPTVKPLIKQSASIAASPSSSSTKVGIASSAVSTISSEPNSLSISEIKSSDQADAPLADPKELSIDARITVLVDGIVANDLALERLFKSVQMMSIFFGHAHLNMTRSLGIFQSIAELPITTAFRTLPAIAPNQLSANAFGYQQQLGIQEEQLKLRQMQNQQLQTRAMYDNSNDPTQPLFPSSPLSATLPIPPSTPISNNRSKRPHDAISQTASGTQPIANLKGDASIHTFSLTSSTELESLEAYRRAKLVKMSEIPGGDAEHVLSTPSAPTVADSDRFVGRRAKNFNNLNTGAGDAPPSPRMPADSFTTIGSSPRIQDSSTPEISPRAGSTSISIMAEDPDTSIVQENEGVGTATQQHLQAYLGVEPYSTPPSATLPLPSDTQLLDSSQVAPTQLLSTEPISEDSSKISVPSSTAPSYTDLQMLHTTTANTVRGSNSIGTSNGTRQIPNAAIHANVVSPSQRPLPMLNPLQQYYQSPSILSMTPTQPLFAPTLPHDNDSVFIPSPTQPLPPQRHPVPFVTQANSARPPLPVLPPRLGAGPVADANLDLGAELVQLFNKCSLRAEHISNLMKIMFATSSNTVESLSHVRQSIAAAMGSSMLSSTPNKLEDDADNFSTVLKTPALNALSSKIKVALSLLKVSQAAHDKVKATVSPAVISGSESALTILPERPPAPKKPMTSSKAASKKGASKIPSLRIMNGDTNEPIGNMDVSSVGETGVDSTSSEHPPVNIKESPESLSFLTSYKRTKDDLEAKQRNLLHLMEEYVELLFNLVQALEKIIRLFAESLTGMGTSLLYSLSTPSQGLDNMPTT